MHFLCFEVCGCGLGASHHSLPTVSAQTKIGVVFLVLSRSRGLRGLRRSKDWRVHFLCFKVCECGLGDCHHSLAKYLEASSKRQLLVHNTEMEWFLCFEQIKR